MVRQSVATTATSSSSLLEFIYEWKMASHEPKQHAKNTLLFCFAVGFDLIWIIVSTMAVVELLQAVEQPK